MHKPYEPSGDQPKAISQLVDGIKKGFKRQTLLGATGTGKTFTMANIIQEIQKPTLVIAHNKTLAAQLASEFERFFPENAVHYFVSYYDYYQPEAYIPTTDTFIEKDAQINKEIDRLRHASTQSLLTRNDVIIVASVSCIYGLGSPEDYEKAHWFLSVGDTFSRQYVLERLIKLHYERTTADLEPGKFRIVGNNVQVMPVSELAMYTLSFSGQKLEGITELDPITAVIRRELKNLFLFPAKHFITNEDEKDRAINSIKVELELQLEKFQTEGKVLEYERLKRRTNYDLAMIREVGYCSGIENYSRHLSGKAEGEPPETLLSYFPHKKDGSADFLVFIDESHVTLPQLQGMYAGDASRKGTLVEHGFRLPSAKDNRPLQIQEFRERVDQVVYVSATPSKVEREESERIAEQIIRPTGLIDPELVVRGVVEVEGYPGQVHDFIREAVEEIKLGRRVLATTLTKKMAEEYLEVYEKIISQAVHSS
jgi:excinuclease ABC subunit B